MRVLLLSAYDADSHARWHRGLCRHCRGHDWIVHALAPRHYAWRAQGNALAFAEAVNRDGSPDLLLVCGTTDLTTLRGLRPDLAAVPAIVYYHDNEFAFPPNPREQGRTERQLRQLINAAAASALVFNSAWNRDSFLAGARALLQHLPDAVPSGLLAALEARAEVLPVPLEEACFVAADAPSARAGAPLQVVWNHRWEWDKGPDRLPSVVEALLEARRSGGPECVLHLCGAQFRRRPSAFDRLAALRAAHPDLIATFGHLEAAAYRALLREADLAVSTALHDFQGLAVLEAAAAGCGVLVPDRLAYPEFFPPRCRYPSRPEAAEAEGRALAEAIIGAAAAPERLRVDVSALGWPQLGAAWSALLERIAA